MVSVCTVPARGGRSCVHFGGYKTINRIPLWQGFENFQNVLPFCAFDESSLSIKRVKHLMIYTYNCSGYSKVDASLTGCYWEVFDITWSGTSSSLMVHQNLLHLIQVMYYKRMWKAAWKYCCNIKYCYVILFLLCSQWIPINKNMMVTIILVMSAVSKLSTVL